MVCKYCGYTTAKNAKFCENCGAALQDNGESSAQSKPCEQESNAYKTTYTNASTNTQTSNIHDDIRRNDVREAEQFFEVPTNNNLTQKSSYSQTSHTVYGRNGTVRHNSVAGGGVVGDGFTKVKNVTHKYRKAISIGASIFIFIFIIILGTSLFASNNYIEETYLTRKAYDQVEIGMSYSEVSIYLGGDCDKEYYSTNGNMQTKVCTWTENVDGKSISIVVTFINGTVSAKTSSNLN